MTRREYVEQIKILYTEKKMSLREVSATISPPLSVQRIAVILRDEGVALRKRGKVGREESNTDRATAVELYQSGLSLPEIALKLNCTLYFAKKTIAEEGVKSPLCKRRHVGWNSASTESKRLEMEAMRKRYEEGATVIDIGKEFNRNLGQVSRELRKAGTKMRGHKNYANAKELHERHMAGETYRSLAKIYEVSCHTVVVRVMWYEARKKEQDR